MTQPVPPSPLPSGDLGDDVRADFYMEDGCVVFTAAYHLRRGSCCGSGCRHCPYGGEAEVTEASTVALPASQADPPVPLPARCDE